MLVGRHRWEIRQLRGYGNLYWRMSDVGRRIQRRMHYLDEAS